MPTGVLFISFFVQLTKSRKKAENPPFLSHKTMLIYVLNNTLKSFIENLGMLQISLESLECRGIIEAVAYTLVGNDLHSNKMMSLTSAIALDSISAEDASVRNEDGKVSEVIEVVIDSRDSKSIRV